jgi:Flp pilus assembly protein TadG
MMSRLQLRSQGNAQARGQGLVEFALITPLLLLFLFGIIEVGRLLAIYSGASSAAQQTARYGSVAGDTGQGRVFYLDCAGMRATAKRTAFLYGLTDGEIQIAYDTGRITDTVGACGADNLPRFTSAARR